MITACSCLLFVSFLAHRGAAQQTAYYQVAFADKAHQTLQVTYRCSEGPSDTFSFCRTIPGTYSVQNYGSFVSAFKVLDQNGKRIAAKEEETGVFVISDPKAVRMIRYEIDESWQHAFGKKGWIFEPAGTAFSNRCIVFNGGGVLGFFAGTEEDPVQVGFQFPEPLYPMSGNRVLETAAGFDVHFENYHCMVDQPILFAMADTCSFDVAGTRIFIGAFTERGEKIAAQVREQIEPLLRATHAFLDTLPADHYSFLVYVRDLEEPYVELEHGDIGLRKAKKLSAEVNVPFGALEHETSSLYFLPDYGDSTYLEMLPQVCVHEFLHILTPLNLKSHPVLDFDYVHPHPTSHLWLYEGVVEYLSGQVLLQGGLLDEEKYLNQHLGIKLRQAKNYPKKVSLVELSEHIYEAKYAQHFEQFYHHAVLVALALDVEIMRLTDAQMTLKDVVLRLSRKYGTERAFDEATIVNEMVAMVHPDLRLFFDRHVYGTEPVPLDQAFEQLGIVFQEETSGRAPVHPIWDNVDAIERIYLLGRTLTIMRFNSEYEDPIGFEKRDKVLDVNELDRFFRNEQGEYVEEGDTVYIEVFRKGQLTKLFFPARFKESVSKQTYVVDAPSNKQALLHARWAGTTRRKDLEMHP